jgi:outer membrane autotransporter protein
VVGITAFSSATVVNSGIISGATGVTAGGAGPWSLTNAGIIVGTAGTAIDFGASAGDTMNFLTGSRVIGLIIPGVGDTVNFGAGNWFYTFAGLPGTSINTNGAPFVVAGNQVAVLDPTSLAQTDRTLMTFTGGISALLQSRFDGIAPIGSGAAGVTAFAPTGSVIADQANAAFASIPTVALAYGADDQPLLKTGAASDSARTVIWASSFGGSRHQEADGVVLRTTDTAVGGVFGIDRVITPYLRLGGFVGGGTDWLQVAFNTQKTTTDYIYGGAYGRFDWVTQYLDFALYGGSSSASSTRGIANNLAPDGFETATATDRGWFISPELTYGVRIPMQDYTLTPRARVRYVAGFFDAFSEQGSAQNLSIASRTVQDVEERLELALSRIDTRAGVGSIKTMVNIGGIALERIGDPAISGVLLGQNLTFLTPGRSSAAGVVVGVGIDWHVVDRVSLFAGAEGTWMSDKSTTAVAKGGVRIGL